ncbi:Bax inhibitor-1/YccA family protein [Candidatus Liberibacter sp.]|uniref:Bax inhibitor-1/YccA family protein n=1 Tax=Candidatus Liberibacter sp. TaxID=34022 RepID=UPI001C70CA1B
MSKNYHSRAVNSKSRVGPIIDQGLRAYMLRVYNLMAFGLIITGVMAFLVNNLATTTSASGHIMLTDFGVALYRSPLRWVVMFAPFGVSLFFSMRLQYLSVHAASVIFGIFSALMGISLSSIFLLYTGQSIVQTFFITAASFGSLSLYGYTTKKDLTAMGSFMIMGAFGLFLAMIVNLFMADPVIQLAMAAIGVIIFSGLTAYDTQRIKDMYSGSYSHDVIGRQAVMGALNLYMDFINMFVFLLQFLGNRRD